MLEAVGVDRAGETVYRSLVETGPGHVQELGDRLGLDGEAVQAALAALADLELVEKDGSGLWSASPPRVALDAVIAREQHLLRQRELELEALARDSAEMLGRLRRNAPVGGVVDIVADPAEARSRCARVVSHATTEVLAVDRWPSPRSMAFGPCDDVPQHELLARGVQIRGVYDRDGLDAPDRFAHLRGLMAAGVQARTLPTVPTKLLICDQRHAIVPLDPDRTAGGAIFVEPSGMLLALVGLFEALWSHAAPLPAPHSPSGGESDDGLDTALLTLLAGGLKDETIGRHLGVSQSTVSRRVARLLATLDASSRFQAGIQAARRGLV